MSPDDSPCAKCSPPPSITISDLPPLPPEIISMIFRHFFFLNHRYCNRHHIQFMRLSRAFYAHHARKLYEQVEIDDANCDSFLEGIWKHTSPISRRDPLSFGGCILLSGTDGRPVWPSSLHKQLYSYCPSQPGGAGEPLLYVSPGSQTGGHAVVPFSLDPFIRKILLLRQCRKISINSRGALDLLRHAGGHVQMRISTLPKVVGVWKKERFPVMSWLKEPLLSSVSHVALGRISKSLTYPAPVDSPLFGPELKHICVSPSRGFYENYPNAFWVPLRRQIVTSFIQQAPSFATGPNKDNLTSFTLHQNAKPGSTRDSLADTMIYDLPRKRALRRWKVQWPEVKSGLKGNWTPGKKPWRIRVRNMAPHPPDADVPKIILKAFARENEALDEECEALFRKWFGETVSFEEARVCDCCGVFQKLEEAAPLPEKKEKKKKKERKKEKRKKKPVDIKNAKDSKKKQHKDSRKGRRNYDGR
ncbi:hypothetical protein L198_07936 [Cryptococcus wingfieldii CBS 7118]|uniref:Uncharacterized protein n=1 Tax=Cryptococcus wingfieldii CBS 7118 TaxID=1295528 RepID=A0A1E3HRV1_9TREE|nr:hypothetical protein L198_07936 [Cryptococcus wingfieldii CBS 7118]ODN79057.1 hypothetical protein L198_07936 [Cryptococcus wingfieldii CBS 7118]